MLSKKFLALLSIFTVAFTQNISTYNYKTVDNLNITLDVYFPIHSPYTKYPVLFAIHGGGYVEGSKNFAITYPEMLEALSLGFLYITIDYRLIPGVLMPDVLQDCQDAYNFVRTELVNDININVDAIVVMGRSAGGALALMGGYTFDPKPTAIIAFYPGLTNFTTPGSYTPNTSVPLALSEAAKLLSKPVLVEYVPKNNIDPYWTLLEEAGKVNKTGWLLVSSDPQEPSDQVIASLMKFSAVYNVDKDYPPTYLMQGLNDTLVPYEQAVAMADVLNATNITYVLDLVPGVDHEFDDDILGPQDPLFQEHIIPAFDFAVHMIQSQPRIEFETIIA